MAEATEEYQREAKDIEGFQTEARTLGKRKSEEDSSLYVEKYPSSF